MAEESLVKEALTEEMKSSGAALVKKLDPRKWPAALWFYSSESNAWRLLRAPRDLATTGPRRAYEIILHLIQNDRRKTHSLALEDTSVTDPNSELIRVLTSAIPTGPGPVGRRLLRTVVNGHYIDDAFIYRLYSPPQRKTRNGA